MNEEELIASIVRFSDLFKLVRKEEIEIVEKKMPNDVKSMSVYMEGSRYIVLDKELSTEAKKKEVSYQLAYHLLKKNKSEKIAFFHLHGKNKEEKNVVEAANLLLQ